MEAKQYLCFYIDDSGQFYKGQDHFIYAGYVFLDKEKRSVSKRKYMALIKKIGKYLNRTDELKASTLDAKHKRAFLNVMKDIIAFAVIVNVDKIHNRIIEDKKSRGRYKDYALKRVIKCVTEELISRGLIDSEAYVNIYIKIDEQSTVSNGYYNLRDSIYTELVQGVSNFDYGYIHEPILKSGAAIHLEYCCSDKEPLIQAADILANHVFNVARENTILKRKDLIKLILP